MSWLNSDCFSLVGATMGTPADVVKARIMNQVSKMCNFYAFYYHQL